MLGVRSFHESFYGTPKAAETGRRGKKRQPKAKEEPDNEIAVVGVHYRSFDDDSMAAFVNSPAAQVPWNGDNTLLIDRYDVRHLLQDLSGTRRRRRPPSPSLDASKEELDYERYRDLEGLENPSPVPEDDEHKYENEPGGLYQRVGFNYSSGGNQSAQGESGDRSTEEAAFIPPFFVPEHLLSKLPSSLKVHQIMAGTAKYVIEHGAQAEIFFRVKQASNPTFGFLMPDHYHHEYFRFLVDNPQHVGIGLNPEPVAAVEVLSEEAEGGLSLLGTAYGDSDEEEADVVTEAKRDQLETEDCEALEKGADCSEERSEGSEHGSHRKTSPTLDQRTAEGTENESSDSGDSKDPTSAVEVPGSQSHDAVVRGDGIPESGKGETVAGLAEPLPPGTETSDPMEVEYDECNGSSGCLEEELPPYKEPPVQQRRIIDKMVEFISRNGKEFEAIVRERDKKDARFQFLLPWNEYYPYFSRSLEASQQANACSDLPSNGAPSVDESSGVSATGDASDDHLVNDHFLKGVPYWDESAVLDTSTGHEEVGVLETEEKKPDTSDSETGGMGFDAVMAAVRAATRGLSRAVEDGEAASSQPKSPERLHQPEIGSDDAVMAAVRAATGAARRSKPEDPYAVVKGEVVQLGRSIASTGATEQSLVHVVEGGREGEKNLSASGAPVSTLEVNPGSDGDVVVVAKEVAKAAALAAGQEGDSADALLSPAGKRKAERLKKAKLFAAMIREGTGLLMPSGQGSGSHGVSASPSVEKSSQAGVCTDVNLKDNVSDKVQNVLETIKPAGEVCKEGTPEIREQTGDAFVPHVDVEDDTQPTSESGKEKKLKTKSKEADEKYRKHHRKRKSHHDGEERRKEGKDDSETEQRRDRRHDQDQEEKRKGRRRDNDGESKSRDKNGHNLGEERKEAKEYRKDRRYRHDADNKRESRHGYDYEEMSWHEDRHGHELEGKDRSSRHRRRHGSEERMSEGSYQNGNEKRKDSEHDHDLEEKRKERRHREGSEDGRESQHRHGSDERRNDRRHSHGKRKKHKEHVRDVSEGEDEKPVQRKSRKHRQDLEMDSTYSYYGKHSTHGGDTPDNRMYRDTGPEKHQEVVDPLQVAVPAPSPVREPPSTPVDVPDDIRAKVRAMLARI